MAEKSETKKGGKGKLLMIVVPIVLLLVVGVGYKKFMVKKVPPPKMKIEGTLLPLASDFVVNLAGNRYGKVTVALLVDPKDVPPGQNKGAGSPPAQLAQDPVIRSIITDDLTGIDAQELIDRAKRVVLLKQIVTDLTKQTDEHVKNVYFTDIAVQ